LKHVVAVVRERIPWLCYRAFASFGHSGHARAIHISILALQKNVVVPAAFLCDIEEAGAPGQRPA
jgi:hypothetical protein